MEISNAAYLAGLFDGEGCVTCKQYMRKRKGKKKAYPTWNIQMEISMTDEATIRYVHDILKVGSVNKRPPHKTSMGKKMQWRWRCSYRDAYYVAKLFWPYTQTKLHKLEQIIDHYNPELGHKNVVNLEDYRNEKG
jgi:hypothetical protein